jgi:hypothetical protein
MKGNSSGVQVPPQKEMDDKVFLAKEKLVSWPDPLFCLSPSRSQNGVVRSTSWIPEFAQTFLVFMNGRLYG